MSELKFRPLTEGLGFHQEQAAPKLPATPPRFVTEVKSRAQPVATYQALPVAAPVLPARKHQAPSSQPSPVPTYHHDDSYIVRRFWAYIVDFSIHSLICILAFGIAIWVLDLPLLTIATLKTLAMMAGFMLFFNASLILAEEIAVGTTPGKSFLDLKIEGTPIRLVLRTIFFYVGTVAAGIGWIPALFTKKQSALHDWITGTQPSSTYET